MPLINGSNIDADLAKLPATESGCVERFVRLYGEDVRYCRQWKQWLIWDGRRWKMADATDIYIFIMFTVRKIHDEAATLDNFEDRRRLVQWANMCGVKIRIELLTRLVSKDERIAISLKTAYDMTGKVL